ncbi:MAG TPA: hypothetical protein VE781_06010, partial [Kineosporiaceae bacterium]|nr:hypothetical protein [Kineosporiaceae bacterium]
RPPWELYGWGRVVAVAAVPLVIAVVEVAVLLRLRSRGARWLQPSPSMALDRGERRRLVRSIREGEHLPGRDGDLARDLAERMARQRWFLAPAVVPILLALVTVAVRGFDAVGVVMTVAALVVAVSLPFAVRDVRQARRYLHDEQPPAT